MGRRSKVGGFGPAVWVWWLVSGAVDFRCGADRLLVHVREVLEREPLDGSAFVFRNRRGTRLKVLVVDAQGVWLAQRRLHRGRFVLPRQRGDLVLDPARHAVVCEDREMLLTPTEFRMLAAITSRPGEVVRRRAVVAAAWPDGAIVSENTIDSYAARLRRKLHQVGSPVELRTVRGVGFTLK